MKNISIFFLPLIGLLNIAYADEQLTDQEKVAYALLGSISDIAVARIDASGCYEMRGQYPIKLFATGVAGQRRQNNMATAKLPDHSSSVVAFPKNKIPEVGSQVVTLSTRTSDFNLFDPVKNYGGFYSFDFTSGSASMVGNVELFLNYSYSTSQAYQVESKTAFRFSETVGQESIDLTNLGEGSSQLLTLEAPKAKYQQRVTMARDSGTNAHTLFVRDLLASYRQYCRVKAELLGSNSSSLFSQEGYLTIDMSRPDDPIVLFF